MTLLSKLKHLQPIVPRIDRDDAVSLIDGHAPRIGELAGVAAAGAPGLEALAGGLVDHLHAIVAELADDQVALAILVEAIRKSELSKARADVAHVPHECA